MIPWSQGIGFAIAVDRIKDVYNELIETGTVQTPWMGIVGVTLNKGIASNYRIGTDRGALVIEVPRGPSLEAGLQAGDAIVAIDGKDINGMDEVRSLILSKHVGDKLLVRFVRVNDVFEAWITLVAAP